MLRKNSTSFLIFLALRNKIRAGRSAMAQIFLSPLAPSGSRASRGAPGGSRAQSLVSCFGALCRAVSTPGWTSFLTVLISAQILFFSVFWFQTLPGRDPISFLAPELFGEMLTDDSLLADGPDWTAVRCSDGSIVRIGACPTSTDNEGGQIPEGAVRESKHLSVGGEGALGERVGDVRATLGRSLILLRERALPPHLSAVEAQATRDLARQMSARRAQIFSFPLTKLGLWLFVCCAGWIVTCLSLLAVGARAARALTHLLKNPKNPIQAFNVFLGGIQGGFIFSLFSSITQGVAFAMLLGFGVGQLSALAIEANLPVPVLAVVDSATSSAILLPSPLANTKQAITLGKDPRSEMQRPFGAPADAIKLVGMENRVHPPKGAKLGQWSIHEIAFENTELLLSQRAPSLTTEQRRDALWLMKCLRNSIRGGDAEAVARVSIMGLSAAIVLAGLVGAGFFFSSMVRKAKNKAANALQALAVEGSQLSLAQHEQEELSSVLRKKSDSTPLRGAKRL